MSSPENLLTMQRLEKRKQSINNKYTFMSRFTTQKKNFTQKIVFFFFFSVKQNKKENSICKKNVDFYF